MPTAAGFFAYGKTWTRMGPFQLGPVLFKVIGVVSVLGVLLLIWIGIQPPNQKALVVALIATVLMLACWWLGVRKVFRGPPVTSTTLKK